MVRAAPRERRTGEPGAGGLQAVAEERLDPVDSEGRLRPPVGASRREGGEESTGVESPSNCRPLGWDPDIPPRGDQVVRLEVLRGVPERVGADGPAPPGRNGRPVISAGHTHSIGRF